MREEYLQKKKSSPMTDDDLRNVYDSLLDGLGMVTDGNRHETDKKDSSISV